MHGVAVLYGKGLGIGDMGCKGLVDRAVGGHPGYRVEELVEKAVGCSAGGHSIDGGGQSYKVQCIGREADSNLKRRT